MHNQLFVKVLPCWGFCHTDVMYHIAVFRLTSLNGGGIGPLNNIHALGYHAHLGTLVEPETFHKTCGWLTLSRRTWLKQTSSRNQSVCKNFSSMYDTNYLFSNFYALHLNLPMFVHLFENFKEFTTKVEKWGHSCPMDTSLVIVIAVKCIVLY